MPPEPSTRVSDRANQVTFDRFELEVTEGEDDGHKSAFGQETVHVGTAQANDFVLSDRTVSRFHAKISCSSAGFVLHDLDSTNGTALGGHRVREAYLDRATTIQLGSTKLAFRPLGDQVAVDLPARDGLGQILGSSTAMRKLYSLVERVAASTLPVVIEGETGTGKDLVARVIHAHSDRADQPFDVLDCTAIPPSLVESELFGHVKGAFTGAERDRAGIFERNDAGTVFLDEIGELDLNIQPKLLRVLEAGEVRRVGSANTIKVDVRIIAATLRNLRQRVNTKDFREDLYYRLAGCRIEVPPLRERRDDIPLLARHFLEHVRMPPHRVAPDSLDADTLAVFMTHPWPGNVRQLRNAVERLALMGAVELSRPGVGEGNPEVDLTSMTLREARERCDRQYLEAQLARHEGDLAEVARVAEVHERTLRRILARDVLER